MEEFDSEFDLNYDTTFCTFQIKDAKSKDAIFIKDIDIMDSRIKNGKIVNCRLYGCEVKNSEVYESQLINGNKVIDSKFQESSADYGNSLDNCYIDSPGKKIDCEVKGGIIRKADLGRNAEVSKETEKVNDFNELRMTRFITDSRLKDLNDPSKKINFKNSNY